MSGRAREYIVCNSGELRQGERRIITIGKREIGIFHIEGGYYGLSNVCPHQLGPACKGKISGTLRATKDTGWNLEWVKEGEIVTCPWHGLEYDIRTGNSLALKDLRLPCYEVWEEDGVVKIRL